jgi:hypothetical protein
VYLSRALAESVEPIAGSAPDPMDRPGRTAAQLPLLLRSPAAWLLSAIPAYSEQSKQFRRLLIDGESSGRWSFSPISPSGTTLTDRASWAGPLRVKSLAPSAVDVLASSAGRVAFLSLVALLLLALLRALSKVVVQGLFGPAPHGTLERRPESLGAARAMVLVAPRPDIDTVMRTYPRASVFCLDLRQPRELWMGAEQAARQGVSKVFLLDRLEDLLEEGSRVEDLLVLLRQLLDDAPSTVVLLCEEDPFAILDAELARAEQGHTMPRAILQQLRSRMSDAETPEIAEIAAALSSPDASLDPSEEALGKVAERHYRELWEECSVPERLVLFHVARDGFISRNGWGLVARLQRRGLVRKDPVLRIMNQSFRAFVLRAETLPTIKEWEEETGAGGAHVRGALTVAALAAGAFFLFTQRDQLTALATILPPLAAILSFVPRMFAAIPSNRASGGSSESS